MPLLDTDISEADRKKEKIFLGNLGSDHVITRIREKFPLIWGNRNICVRKSFINNFASFSEFPLFLTVWELYTFLCGLNGSAGASLVLLVKIRKIKQTCVWTKPFFYQIFGRTGLIWFYCTCLRPVILVSEVKFYCWV